MNDLLPQPVRSHFHTFVDRRNLASIALIVKIEDFSAWLLVFYLAEVAVAQALFQRVLERIGRCVRRLAETASVKMGGGSP